MKPQIALSLDQMHELESLGLDYSDASMCWIIKPSHNYAAFLTVKRPGTIISAESIRILTYTAEDILIKLPSTLEISNSDDILHYDLCIFPLWKSGLWCVKYNGHSGDLKTMSARDLIKCAFEMLKWVIVNHPNKIKLCNESKL